VTVPLTLLGLLERGPSHGYDLKRDYDAFFGRGKPLRYSQVYATLSRLARDGKAIPGPIEQEAGPERRRYVITEAGMADVARWLAEPASHSTCCSPTTPSTDWRLTCDGSTTPRPGWICSRERYASDRRR